MSAELRNARPTRQQTPHWSPTLWGMVLLLLIGFGLSVYQIDQFSLWLDEGLTPMRADYQLDKILQNTLTLQKFDSQDTHPPLYFILIHFGRRLIGTSDFALRLPSAYFALLLVPVMMNMGRLVGGRAAGWCAAILTFVCPILVWHAQEARMYTLQILLVALATWQLLLAIKEGVTVRRLLFYLLFAGAALYTHYTTAFLMIGQGVVVCWLLWHSSLRRWLIGLFVLGAIAAVPLVPYTLPRLLTGAETAYSFVPVHVIVLDLLRGFGLGQTANWPDAVVPWLMLGYALVLAWAVIGLWHRPNQRPTIILLLLSLLAPPLLIGVMGYLKPMYLTVRHILTALPAFLLLLALGVGMLPRLGRWALLIALLIPSVHALQRMYVSPDVAKDDYRGLIAWYERHADSDDVFVYNNALNLPLHEHYQTRDIPWTALPVYPLQASDATDDWMVYLAERYDMIWYSTDPSPDGRDPDKRVEAWLETHATLSYQTAFYGRNADMRLRIYQIAPREATPIVEQATVVNWQGAGLPMLDAVFVDNTPPMNDAILWVRTWWQGNEASQGVRWGLRSADGTLWINASYPFTQSEIPISAAQTYLTYPIVLPPGLPPGSYELLVGSIDYAANVANGDWQTVQRLDLQPASQPLPPGLSAERPLQFANGMELLAAVPAADAVRPGNPLPITTYWRITQPLSTPVELSVEASKSGQLGAVDRATIDPRHWPLNTPVAVRMGLFFAPDAPAGDYQLRWQLFDAEQAEPIQARFAGLDWWRDARSLVSVTVESWPMVTALPEDDVVRLNNAQFGNTVELAGYTLSADTVAAGDSLDVTLYWRANAQPDNNYVVFLHWVNAADQPPLAQSNSVPVGSSRPTRGWRAGEILTDARSIVVPADLPAGEYQLYVGLYEPESGIRLPVSADGEAQPFDQYHLTTVTVP